MKRLLLVPILASLFGCQPKPKDDADYLHDIAQAMKELEKRGYVEIYPDGYMTWARHENGSWSAATAKIEAGDLLPGEKLSVVIGAPQIYKRPTPSPEKL